MKTIGLIGGTGWVSTVEYYRQLNEKINIRLGGLNFARCILYSFNYGEIDVYNQQGDTESVYKLVADAAEKLALSGADCLALCANTLHRYADQLQARVDLPLIHIAEATASEIRKLGIERIGLLGTRPTMEENFYREKLDARGIKTIIPPGPDRAFIHQAINSELILNIFKQETRQRFQEIMKSLETEGAQAIVLGCTEIPLLISQADFYLPVLNTLDIHTSAIVAFSLDNR